MKEFVPGPTDSNEGKSENRAEIVGELFQEKVVEELVTLEREVFEDVTEDVLVEEDEFVKVLESGGAQVLLRNKEGKMVGALLSMPHTKAIELLIAQDPELVPDDTALYVYFLGIRPEDRSLDNLFLLKDAFLKLARDRGYTKLTGHFRVGDKLSEVMQQRYGAAFVRRKENWFDTDETVDYLEVDLTKLGS
jgi:predicted GNAT superfamily acetyltransferase